jgi:membrane protein implicated in regulation of membrane protease activity
MEALTAWYNIVFIIPMALGMVLAVGSVLGGGLDGEHDYDHGAGDHDVHGDQGGNPLDMSPKQSRSIFLRLLSAFGFGRVPLMILLMMASLIFGGAGFISNSFLEPLLVTPWVYFWISLGIALVCMSFLTGRIARAINKFMPTIESHGITKSDLIGSTGSLVLPTDTKSGTAHVKDAAGDLHRVNVRTEEGVLNVGVPILILDFEPETNTYVVQENSVGELTRSEPA